MDAHEAYGEALGSAALKAIAGARLVIEAQSAAESVEVLLGAGMPADSEIVIASTLAYTRAWQLRAIRTSLGDLVKDAHHVSSRQPLNDPPNMASGSEQSQKDLDRPFQRRDWVSPTYEIPQPIGIDGKLGGNDLELGLYASARPERPVTRLLLV